MAAKESIEILTDRVSKLACHQCGCRINVSEERPFTTVECPDCHVHTPVPAQLGSFLLFKELGKGAMGAVYQAFDKTLKRHVAIKVMHRSLGEDQQFVQKFLGEARALAALNHEHIVQIYSCGTEKGQPYIVMELVPGRRLDELMEEPGALGETRTLEIGLQIAEGLNAAHEIGLVHGDIKPENILFDRHQTAKVVDFGLARFPGQKPDQGEVWGTPYYIAPEKVRGEQTDHRADIYCLGATLYHALAGRPPFDGKTARDVVLARLQGPAPDLRAFRENLHPETAAVIARMLEASVSRRYPNYASLLADLRQALGVLRRSVEATTRSPPRRTATVVAVLGILLLGGGVGAGLWWALRHRRLSPPEQAPVRLELVDGKLVRVPAEAPAKPAPRPPAAPPSDASGGAPSPHAPAAATEALSAENARFILSTSDGDGADTYVQGRSSSRNFADTAFGRKKELWVKAAEEKSLHLARKVYLRFDLSTLRVAALSDATLRLTVVKSGLNATDGRYALRLWGMPARAGSGAWTGAESESRLTWNTAPANARSSGDALTPEAILLATVPIPANPEPGSVILLSNRDSVGAKALVEFVQQSLERGAAVFAVTASSESEQRSGWKFASKENRKSPGPTLWLR